MNTLDTRVMMTKMIPTEDRVYTRRELTALFWIHHPVYCAHLLLKSPVNDRTAIEILEGIITFDTFKIGHNRYKV